MFVRQELLPVVALHVKKFFSHEVKQKIINLAHIIISALATKTSLSENKTYLHALP